MARRPVLVRDAVPADADDLVALWSPTDRPADRAADRSGGRPPAEYAAASVARIAAEPDQRLLVARLGEDVAGAVHLVRGPLSPVQEDVAVYVMHLQVHESLRRHGVGHALMSAVVAWAEEKDSTHVIAGASVVSRDANRFMARLGLGQIATVRGATVAALRAKLPVEAPAAARVGGRHPLGHRSVSQVLVQRRSMRRSQVRPGGAAD